MKTATQESCKWIGNMNREEKFQREIHTWLWFSNLPKSKSILKNYFIMKLQRKEKEGEKKINKDESGIKDTGIFLFQL